MVAGSTYGMMGVCNATASGTSFLGNDNNGCGYLSDGNVLLGGATIATYATYTSANVIKMALNVSAKTVTFYKDGALQGTVDISAITGAYFGAASTYDNAPDAVTMNFGQSGSVSPPATYDDGFYS